MDRGYSDISTKFQAVTPSLVTRRNQNIVASVTGHRVRRIDWIIIAVVYGYGARPYCSQSKPPMLIPYQPLSTFFHFLVLGHSERAPLPLHWICWMCSSTIQPLGRASPPYVMRAHQCFQGFALTIVQPSHRLPASADHDYQPSSHHQILREFWGYLSYFFGEGPRHLWKFRSPARTPNPPWARPLPLTTHLPTGAANRKLSIYSFSLGGCTASRIRRQAPIERLKSPSFDGRNSPGCCLSRLRHDPPIPPFLAPPCFGCRCQPSRHQPISSNAPLGQEI